MSNRIFRRTNQRGAGPLEVILWMVGGLVLLVALVVAVSIWAVSSLVDVEVSETEDGKQVEISTPFGDLSIEGAESVASKLKLPVYPGAEPEDEGGSVRFRGRIGDEEGGFSARGAHFRTRDSLDEVDAWYREQLGSEYERKEGHQVVITGRHDGFPGDIDIEIDGVAYVVESRGRVRGVILEPKGSRVDIGLFELREARRQ